MINTVLLSITSAIPTEEMIKTVLLSIALLIPTVFLIFIAINIKSVEKYIMKKIFKGKNNEKR